MSSTQTVTTQQAPATAIKQEQQKSQPEQTQEPNNKAQEARIAYCGPPLPSVPDDVVVPGILDIECDERLWIPQVPDVCRAFFPAIVTPVPFTRLSFVAAGTTLSILGGQLREYTREPPGDIHTLEVPEDVNEMVTLFPVTGAYIYVDPDGNPTGIEDVYSKLDKARNHYEAIGLDADFVNQFVR